MMYADNTIDEQEITCPICKETVTQITVTRIHEEVKIFLMNEDYTPHKCEVK